jgi:hypothetical protein
VDPITVRVVLLSAHADTRELYAQIIRADGFEVHVAGALENVPPRAADVVVVQLHPHDDAEHIALTLRARTRCDVLIALVSFRLKIDAGIFDHVALVPLMPPDLVKVICSLTPC